MCGAPPWLRGSEGKCPDDPAITGALRQRAQANQTRRHVTHDVTEAPLDLGPPGILRQWSSMVGSGVMRA